MRELKPWKYHLPWITDIFMHYYKISPYKDGILKLKSPFPIIIKRVKDSIKRLSDKLEWRFPREKISKGSKIILYGAGDVGKVFWNWLQDTDYCKVILWIDKKYDKINSNADTGGGMYASPDSIKNCRQYDYILIASVRANVIASVSKFLTDAGVPKEKIVTL